MLASAPYADSQKAKSWYHTGFPQPVFFPKSERHFAHGFAWRAAGNLVRTRAARIRS